ncbi:MAG: molybdenum cofactor guanylyltransferase [Deltaproteobacteria bacterium]|nr:MAG: molybdenum cofactor guanylyltransferase [Deltaproteobacteria bacterium]
MTAPAGYVLAGGQSRRMGRPKAFIEIGGLPMALRVARAMVDAGVQPVHLVGKDPSLASLGLPLVPDGTPDQHPLVGLVRALEHAAGIGRVRALVAPCDLPLLGPEHLVALLRADRPVVARTADRRHPLLAVLETAMLPDLQEALASRLSVRAALAALPGVELPADALLNVNHPHEIPDLPDAPVG